MGFIKAALSAGISSFQDSKFKEAITLPEAVPATALAIKGQLLTKDPDGRSRQSNQNTGLLTDGSVVIVPQGYVALLVNNGTFLGDLLEAGSHEWQAGENAWLFEKGGVKGTWDQFKNRFSFGGQVVTQQEIIFVRMQPFTGNKFGTQNPVEYFSDRYQQLLSIRFYGLYDVKVADQSLQISRLPWKMWLRAPCAKIWHQKLQWPFQNIQQKIRRKFTTSMRTKMFLMKLQNAKSTKLGQNYMVSN